MKNIYAIIGNVIAGGYVLILFLTNMIRNATNTPVILNVNVENARLFMNEKEKLRANLLYYKNLVRKQQLIAIVAKQVQERCFEDIDKIEDILLRDVPEEIISYVNEEENKEYSVEIGVINKEEYE
jgi:hypothetical protein